MKIFTKLILVSLSMLLSSISHMAYAEVVVIVHPSNPLTEMSIDEVKKIYLGKKKSFPSGEKIIPGDQPTGTQSRKLFSDKIIGKSERKLKSYWSRLIFTGKGMPPKVIGVDREIKEWVAKQPQAVGYIMRSEADDTVKILLNLDLARL